MTTPSAIPALAPEDIPGLDAALEVALETVG